MPDSHAVATVVTPSKNILSPYLDFWLLGGASIAIWLVMMVAQMFRHDVVLVEQRFGQMAATFGILALICNHPHFMASYRIAYGRGRRFIFQNWISLIAVPTALLLFYAVAYLNFDAEVGDSRFVAAMNTVVRFLGVDFRFGSKINLGTEILSLSIWLMYFTVGWHYAKQVFGCMLIYGRYDGYAISPRQRRWIKLSVFSVAFYQFVKLAATSSSAEGFSFFGMELPSIGLPSVLLILAYGWLVASAVSVCYLVFYKNYVAFGRWPSLNFIVSWVAFYVWWVPVTEQPEFYFIMVPFFHSLQYLPFAFRMERATIGRESQRYHRRLTIRALVILLAGFLAFELIPSSLDSALQTSSSKTTWFFLIAAAVFINVHHFFIDSTIWRFNQAEVKKALL